MKPKKFRVWTKFDSGNHGMLDHDGIKGWTVQELLEDPDDVVMQWTGLKDVDGKEIYEDDVLELVTDELSSDFLESCLSHTGVVKWVDGCEYWMSLFFPKFVKVSGGEEFLVLRGTEWGDEGNNIESKDVRVIGNLHQDPEYKKEDRLGDNE